MSNLTAQTGHMSVGPFIAGSALVGVAALMGYGAASGDPAVGPLTGFLALAAVTGLGLYAALGRRAARSESSVAALFANSPIGVVGVDPGGAINAINPAARSVLADVGGDGSARTLARALAFDPERERKIFVAMRTAAERGAATAQFSGPDGRGAMLSLQRADGGEFLARLEIAQPEPDLGWKPGAALMDAPVGFFAADSAGTVLFVNALLQEWLGGDEAPASIDALLAEGADRVAPARARPGELTHVAAVLATAQGRRPVEITERVVRVERGGVSEEIALCFVLDTRRRGGAPVRGELGLTSAFLNAPVAMAVIGEDGVILAGNDALSSISDGAARIGERLSVAVKMDSRSAVDELAARVSRGDASPDPIEVNLRSAGGTERVASLHIQRSRVEGEAHIIAFLIDISQEKRLETQFAQSQKMQAVGQLAGGVAHDFNNLLTAIIGHTDLLLQRFDAEDPAFQDANLVRSNATRAASLVKKLLAFSRRQTLNRVQIQLTDQLAETSHMINRMLGERIELQVRHGRDLWPVVIDTGEFDRVIMNLCVNARDAMPDGGVITIRTRNVPKDEIASMSHAIMQQPEDYVLIEVVDTGTGMPPEVRGQIFDPFYTTKPTGQGTGLGLSTVYGIVKQFGGFIFVESELGKGSTFRIYLPRAQGETAAAKVETGSDRETDVTGNASILLVEDEDAVRAFASRALKMRGYNVHAAASGEEALALLDDDELQIDLVISDVVMPQMDGPTMLRRLREIRPNAKVIFISGYAEEAFRKSLRGDEEFSFLPKPFSLKELGVKVRQALGGGD